MGLGVTDRDGEFALEGVRVLDLSVLLPATFGTSLLVDLGADVVKIERPPAGDPARHVAPGAFEVLNRGKRSIALDLRDPCDSQRFDELVRGADVLVENFRPGVTERLGIASQRLCELNPRLVYCTVTGYGRAGPYAHRAGHDVNFQGLTGALWLSGDPDRVPRQSGGLPVSDLVAGLFSVQAILAALLRRERTGEGARLELPIAGATLKFVEGRLADHVHGGRPDRSHFLQRGAYGVFAGSDGARFTLACVEDQAWQSLCAAIGADDLAGDEKYRSFPQRCRHAVSLNEQLDVVFRRRPAAVWLGLLLDRDVPVSPVLSPEDLEKEPAVSALGLLSLAPDGLPRVAYPVRGLPVSDPALAPLVDADRDQLLGE